MSSRPRRVLRGRLSAAPTFGAALLACSALAVFAPSAWATSPFPVTESFQNATLVTPSDWSLGDSAYLTASNGTDPAGSGWLRLTDATNSEEGYIYNTQAFPSSNGIDITFKYASYGGTGADGLTFFLFNGATTTFAPGPVGGSLGYASCPSSSLNGLAGGYVGIGFDEFGNFDNSSFCGAGGTVSGLAPNRITVRGAAFPGAAPSTAGNSASGSYPVITSVAASSPLDQASPTTPLLVNVSITPDDKLTVYVTYPNGSNQQVVGGYQLPLADLPSTLKFGWIASTGGSNDVHEVDNTTVAEPADLTTTVTGPSSAARGANLTYTATVTNNGQNEVATDDLAATSPDGPLSNVTWTCTGADCPVSSGVGMPDQSADLPVGDSVVYTITGTTTASDTEGSLTFTATPSGATAQSVPGDNVASATTEITPAVTPSGSAPSIALANSNGYTGVATLTQGTYSGGGLTVSDQWQRCDASGDNCTDISGATGSTYNTSSADYGHTLQVVESVSNAQSTTTETTNLLSPDATASVGYSGGAVTASTSASFSLTANTVTATFQCNLDSSGWSNCTSSPSFSGLADGQHTLAVRAVDAGLSQLTATTDTWTVDSSTPVDTSACGTPDSAGYFLTDPTCTVQGIDAADGISYVEYQLDSGAIVTTSPGTTSASVPVTGDGTHTLRTQVFNLAGTGSGWSTQTINVDAATPAHGLTGPTSGPTATAQPTVDFTGVPGSTYTITVDGVPVATGVVPASGSGSVTLPTLSDGAHTVEVIETSPHGASVTQAITITEEISTLVAPTITSGPAAITSQTTASFGFSEPASARATGYQCSVDGSAWAACPNPNVLSGLANGPHQLLVRAVDAAGSVSSSTQYAWTIDTAKPAAPTLLGGPATQTVSGSAHFAISAAPETTLECSLDGAVYKPCGATISLKRVGLGRHVLRVIQIDAAGVASAPAVYRWSRLKRHDTERPAKKATLLVGANSSSTGDGSLEVGCNLNAGSVRRCVVVATADGRTIGTGRIALAHRGSIHAALAVVFNKQGRRLLALARGGLRIHLHADVTPFGSARLQASNHTLTFRPLRLLVQDVLFDFNSAALNANGRQIVTGLSAELRDSAAVRCVGNTDSRGSAAYNRTLGLRRAQTVCRALRADGVRARTTSASNGESRPVASNSTTAGRHTNRRVELQVTYRVDR